jgi:hypothetical protein
MERFFLFSTLLLTVFLIDAKSFKQEFDHLKKAGVPPWAKKQIDHDLAPYRDGITKADLDAAVQGMRSYARYTIKNGVITVTSRTKNGITKARVTLFEQVLRDLLTFTTLPNSDFIVELGDVCPPSRREVPVFCISKRMKDSSVIIIPDFIKFEQASRFKKEAELGSILYRWKSKKNKALWRGSTTGGKFNYHNIDSFNRSRLMWLANKHSHSIDAKFTSVAQHDPRVEKELKKRGYFAQFLSIADQIRYRYLLAVDGNTWPSSFFWQLFSNSLTLKQDSSFIEWYYGGLKPYVHYVPFKRDFSDLLTQLAWIRDHPKQSKVIINNARSFARTYLNRTNLYHYVYCVLKAYSKLYKRGLEKR